MKLQIRWIVLYTYYLLILCLSRFHLPICCVFFLPHFMYILQSSRHRRVPSSTPNLLGIPQFEPLTPDPTQPLVAPPTGPSSARCSVTAAVYSKGPASSSFALTSTGVPMGQATISSGSNEQRNKKNMNKNGGKIGAASAAIVPADTEIKQHKKNNIKKEKEQEKRPEIRRSKKHHDTEDEEEDISSSSSSSSEESEEDHNKPLTRGQLARMRLQEKQREKEREKWTEKKEEEDEEEISASSATHSDHTDSDPSPFMRKNIEDRSRSSLPPPSSSSSAPLSRHLMKKANLSLIERPSARRSLDSSEED